MEAANKREKIIVDKIFSQPNVIIIKDKEARTLCSLTPMKFSVERHIIVEDLF